MISYKFVIFSDLDGSLLDRNNYSFEEAIPALKIIKEKEIPLVLCSSKTRAEIEVIRERLGCYDPFISENGGAVFIPAGYFGSEFKSDRIIGDYYVIELGTQYSILRRYLKEIRKGSSCSVEGFGDMSSHKIAKLTGLRIDDAGRAKEREYDEAFILQGDEREKKEVLGRIRKKGLNYTIGTSYYHLIGNSDKGKGVEILKRLYNKRYHKIKSIALGDGINDLPMLKTVDIPILIKRDESGYVEGIDIPNLLRVGKGPKGWKDAILQII